MGNDMTKTAAILGGGVIGGGWAARFLLMGWEVRVFDPDPEAARKISAGGMPAGHPDISGEAAPAPTATGIEAYEAGKDIAYV